MKIFNDFAGVRIFKGASVDTCISKIMKGYKSNNKIRVDDEYYMEQEILNKKSFIFNSPETLNLKDKILKQGTLIKDLDIEINWGIKTGFNKAFVIDEDTKNELIEKDSKNKEIIKPLLRGRDINKWQMEYRNLYLIFTRRGININKYPYIKSYLKQYKADLMPKDKNAKRSDKGRKPGSYKWYEIQDNVAFYQLFDEEKLIFPEIAKSIRAVYDDNKFYTNQKCYILCSNTINLKYLLGLLNSKVLEFTFTLIGAGSDVGKRLMVQLPIPEVSLEEQEPLIQMVEQMIKLQSELAATNTPHERQMIERQIPETEDKINQLVYELYNLTPEEIAIIEEKTS